MQTTKISAKLKPLPPTEQAVPLDSIMKNRTLNVAGVVDDIIHELMPSIRVRVYRMLATELEELARLSIKQGLNGIYGKMGRPAELGARSNGNGHYFDTDDIPEGHNPKSATEKVVAAAAPPPKAVLTPAQKRRQKLHGRYVGLIAHSTPDVRKKAKAIFAEQGVNAALEFLDRKKNLKVARKAKKKA